MSATLNQTLHRLGYTTEPGEHGQRVIVDADGIAVFVGTAGDVWTWLRASGALPSAEEANR